MRYVKPLPDHEIRAGLVAAHRQRTLMPGGSLETSIAMLRRELQRTLAALHDATVIGNCLAARLGLSCLEDRPIDRDPNSRRDKVSDLEENAAYRVALAKDLARQRRHLAELEEALRVVEYQDAAQVIRRLSRAMGAETAV